MKKDLTQNIKTEMLDRPTDRPRFHCLFEQSGTFKNEFKKLGYEAWDYDILNDYDETDYQIDLFAEIEKGYDGQPSIFDNIRQTDVIMAFFPCTRFEAKIPLAFRGEAFQMLKYSDRQKLSYSMNLHKELHRNYLLISKMACIAIDRDLRLIIENPYTAPHYLTTYWCLKPKIIDKDRRNNGDYMKKPTQFWFINIEPTYNIILEPLEYVDQRKCDYITKKNTGKDRTVARSEIHPQYANRFIRQYILGEDFKQEKKELTMFDLFQM